MVLQEEKFVLLLNELSEPDTEDVLLNKLLQKVDEEDRKEAEDSYYVIKRIMKAKSGDEIADISLQSILLGFKWQHLFADMFEGEKAGDRIREFDKKYLSVKNARKRRLL